MEFGYPLQVSFGSSSFFKNGDIIFFRNVDKKNCKAQRSRAPEYQNLIDALYFIFIHTIICSSRVGICYRLFRNIVPECYMK